MQKRVLTPFSEGGQTRTIRVGQGTWQRSGDHGLAPTFGGRLTSTVAAAGAWEDGEYVLKLFAVNTPFGSTVRCRFDGDQVAIEHRLNVAFGGAQTVELTGRRA